jgi:hypothetical protein
LITGYFGRGVDDEKTSYESRCTIGSDGSKEKTMKVIEENRHK